MTDIVESKIGTIHKKVLGNLIDRGDICLFWGASNAGKSLFCYQIAESITLGKNFFDVTDDPDTGESEYYKLKNELDPQKVLYVDFEQTDEQLYSRYTSKDGSVMHKHHPDFKIGQFPGMLVKDKSLYLKAIEKYIKETETKILIIDNMSVIGDNQDKADISRDLLYYIKFLRDEYGLTVILVAHTNKVDRLDPKTETMIKGSSNLFNFADSVFCLSESTKAGNIRYIIQQKCRRDEKYFLSNNVIEIEILKRDDANTVFIFNEYTTETEMLKLVNNEKTTYLKSRIENLLKDDPNITYYQISKKLYETHEFFSGKESSFLKQCERILKLIKKESLKK